MAHGKYSIEAKKALAGMKKAQRVIGYGQKKLVYACKLAYSYAKLIVSLNCYEVSSMGEMVTLIGLVLKLIGPNSRFN